jgi:hypothetical protein
VSDAGDHDPQMPTTPLLDDDTIDALIEGRPVADQHAPLAAFASHVRAAGDGPPPPPGLELARLLRERGPCAGARPDAGSGDDTAAWRPARQRHLVAKVAGVGIAAKIGLGVTAAAAVVGAGAGGLLPDSADRVVRGAIEVVTPFGFGDDSGPASGAGGQRDEGPGSSGTGPDAPGTSAADPDRFGEDVSSDATGESDGEPGVDGQDIADEAPGATNRPTEPDDPGSGTTPDDQGPPVSTGPPPPGAPSPPVTTGPPPDVPVLGPPGVPGAVATSTTAAGSQG